MDDSDCVVVMGSNMAENHPVAFRWPMKAKVEHGAKIIHIDPRFTRTSAVADIYAPVRAGSDIAFLGGVINYVINSEKWNKDPFFKNFVANYTNAATHHQRRLQRHRRSRRRVLRPDSGQGRRARVAVQRLNQPVRRRAPGNMPPGEGPAAAAAKSRTQTGRGFAPLVKSIVRPPVQSLPRRRP